MRCRKVIFLEVSKIDFLQESSKEQTMLFSIKLFRPRQKKMICTKQVKNTLKSIEHAQDFYSSNTIKFKLKIVVLGQK